MNKTITYTLISSEGEQTFFDVPINKALEDIKEQISKNSKWLYIDKDQETLNTVTEEKLLSGTIITLTDMLGGG